jgi:hypothetical protein
MTQAFKPNDLLEQRMVSVASGLLGAKSLSLTEFFEQAYEAFPFGAMIYDEGRSPLSNAIPRNIFLEAFSQIFEAFTVAGSFESYLFVFQRIFGETVDVEFDVPAAGKLNITIVADGIILSDLVERRIVNNEYVFSEIIDDEGDNISLQTIKGFQSQYELEQMLFEMVPAGIYTEINLTVGES